MISTAAPKPIVYQRDVAHHLAKWLWRLALICTPLVFVGHLAFGQELLNGYYDEVVALLFWMTVPLWKWSGRESLGLATATVLIAAAIMFGLFSSLFNDSLGGFPVLPAALLTIFADTKVIIVALGLAFFCFSTMNKGEKSQYDAVSKALWVLALLPLINLPFIVLDLLSSGQSIRGMPLMGRSGAFVTQGIFPHKFLNAISLNIGIIAAWCLLYEGRKVKVLVLLGGVYFVALLTSQDVKSLVSVLVFGVTVTTLRPSRFRLVLAVATVLGAILASVVAGPMISDQIDRFVIGERGQNVRTVAWPTASRLATAYFPLGSGAGTFGSAASFTLGYSPLYYSTGLAQMHGASPNSEDQFLMDFTWPKFVAEYGYIGGGLVMLLVGGLTFLGIRTVSTKSEQPSTNTAYAFGWGMICFLVIQSLGISVLTISYAMVPMSLGISIVLTSQNHKSAMTDGQKRA